MIAATNKKKHSTATKLIPAIAMLVTSATMLSTATYAWFTMNKEVKVTGLNMTATTAGALEISLGGVKAGGLLDNNLGTRPTDTPNELSWKQSIAAGEYYAKISLINPASSVNAKTFYTATDASNAGQTATKFEEATQTATLTKQTALTPNGTIENDGNSTPGYYVDIPVHLRTSSVAPQGSSGEPQIYYKMVINNNDSIDNIEKKTLYKAVRVAFLEANENGDVTSASAEKILAKDDAYYDTGAVSAIGDDNVGSRSVVDVTTTSVFTSSSDTNYRTDTGTYTGLTIPYADGQKYGHADFIVRIWLEGESTSCHNVNAGQSWNIEFSFSMGKFETT